jgi:hypothetical protein
MAAARRAKPQSKGFATLRGFYVVSSSEQNVDLSVSRTHGVEVTTSFFLCDKYKKYCFIVSVR